MLHRMGQDEHTSDNRKDQGDVLVGVEELNFPIVFISNQSEAGLLADVSFRFRAISVWTVVHQELI